MSIPVTTPTLSGSFEIYDALLWEPADGYFLLDRHLERLDRSAAHFRFPLDVGRAREQLLEFALRLPSQPRKVRLDLAADGTLTLRDDPVKPSTPLSVALAKEAIQSGDPFLPHKTSRREVFERALAEYPDGQDVILWNERGEITETCHGNVVVEIEGRRLTPPLACGLLPGTFRAHLIARGEIQEAVLPTSSLGSATAVFMINSIRKWCEMRVSQ